MKLQKAIVNYSPVAMWRVLEDNTTQLIQDTAIPENSRVRIAYYERDVEDVFVKIKYLHQENNTSDYRDVGLYTTVLLDKSEFQELFTFI